MQTEKNLVIKGLKTSNCLERFLKESKYNPADPKQSMSFKMTKGFYNGNR